MNKGFFILSTLIVRMRLTTLLFLAVIIAAAPTTYQNEPEDGFELAWDSVRQGVIGE